MKETTNNIFRNNFISGDKLGVASPQDIARTTIAETTINIPRNNFVTPRNQQGVASPQDIARGTIKETTADIFRNNFITGSQHGVASPQDIARATIKETTVGIPQPNFITPINQHQTAHYQDTARTTLKEGTIEIPYNTNITGSTHGPAFDRTPLRTTIKEGTVEIPYETFVTAVGQSQPTVHPQDIARTTIKETTIDNNHNTNVVSANRSQGQSFNMVPLRTTNKETTVTIPYNTNITAVNQAHGQAFNRTPLPTTIKEMMIENDHISASRMMFTAKVMDIWQKICLHPVLIDNSSRKKFTYLQYRAMPKQEHNNAYNAPIDDRKDILHWYRPPTACGVNLGPMKEQMNVWLKNDTHEISNLNPVYSVNNNLDRPMSTGTTKAPDINLMVPIDLFVDPKILEQLNKNPYNIPYYGTHYG